MKIKIFFSFVFISLKLLLLAQAGNPANPSAKNQPVSVFNGTQTIATSFSLSACGLDYMQVSHPLFGRTGNNFTLSVLQPAAFAIPALPACATIEKIFLYVSTSGTGVGINASITNPASGNSFFPLSLIGSGPDKGGGYAGSHVYRGDITLMYSGAGNYVISGIPAGPAPALDDAYGATLLIIYSDRTQNYTGSIVLADGCLVNTTAGVATATISNFNVCGTPTLTNHFMLVDDLQQYGTSNILLNDVSPNLALLPGNTAPFQFLSAPGASVSSGQSSAVYGVSNLLDTVGIVLAGLYVRTDCLVCPATLSLTAASTPSCLASGTVNVFGGAAPFSYTWTGSAQNTAIVTDLVAGTQTVTATDQFGCLSGTATVTVSTPAPPLGVTSGTACIGFSATLSAAAASAYTWSPAASLDNPAAQNVIATPLATTIYTLDFVNLQGCTGSQTTQVVITNTQTIGAGSTTLCAAQALSLSANSFTGAGYSWTGPGFSSQLSDPVIPVASTTMSGVYDLSVTSVPGCTSMATTSVTVFALPATSIISNAPICSGFNLNLNGSGAALYTWQGPNGYVSFAQNAVINAADTLASGIYTLTGSFANGCSLAVTSSLTVRSLPDPAILTTTNVCVGRNVTFSVSGGPFSQYNWVGPDNFTSNQPSPSITGITLLANGVYTVTVSDPSGCQAIATTTMAALLNPNVSATGTAVCYGAAATLTANGLGFYSWFGPAGYSTTPVVPFTTVAVTNSLTAGVYTVVLISALNSCSAQATTTLFTLPRPTIAATGTIVCFNEPATLTVTGASTYFWTGPNGYLGAGANPVVPFVNGLSSGIYTVVGTATNSCTDTTNVSVGTIPLPVVATTGTLICFNEPFTINSTGAVTYTWTGPASYTSVGANAYVPAVDNVSAGIYTVVGTAPNTCTSNATAVLATMPLPNITATGTVVCLNEPALLLSGGGMPDGSGYQWTGPASYTAGSQNAAIGSATSAAVNVYTVVGTAPNTCTNVTTASLITLPLPTVTATGTLICFGEPFTIVANGAQSYTWTGPSAYGYVGPGAPVVPVDYASSGTYTVVGAAANTCTQVTTATLATMPLPAITATGTIVCISQQPAYLLSGGGIPGGYSWAGPGGYTSGAQNAFIPAALSAFPQTYTVVGTAPNTCTNNAVATLSTYPLPQPVCIAPARACFGSSVTLQGFGAQTYTWSGPYAQLYPQQNKTFSVFNMAQAGTYTLNVTDSNGCKNYTTTFIAIDPQPSGQLLSNNQNKFCTPFCSAFYLKSKESAPLLSTSWSVRGSSITAETFTFCTATPGVENITGYFTDMNGCSNTVTFEIHAYPTPTASFIYAPQGPLESMEEVEFTCTSRGQNLAGRDWHFVSNEGYHSTGKNIRYLFDEAGSFEVAMVVENDWGCRDTAVRTVLVESDFKLFVPNAFTPNGDGMNDTFQPKGRGVQLYDLSIYDRWGIRVYHTTEFEQGWNGTSGAGPSENDTYAWKIMAADKTGKKHYLAGHVTLVK